ncbi:MAG: fimbrillin family protein [Duncaniella sp.]|nr:fimbrillin family protein [Duncaniella sp.]
MSLVLFASVLVAGCSQESDAPVPTTPDEPKKLEIKISPSMTESRATDYGFESGDCTGLYVVNYSGSVPGTLANSGNYVDNMRFTYNGTWVPDTPLFWADDETHADFYLYYPYTKVQSVKAHAFTVKADQSAEADYKASDLLVGKTVNVTPSASATVIPVSHVMSRIIIALEAGNGFTAGSLAQAAVSVKINGVKCSSTVDLTTGIVTPTGSATSVTPLYADNTYKALIVPQTVAEGNLITVNVDGRDFNLKKGFTFESAKSHKFTVTLSKTSNGVNVNINPWIEDDTDNGGTAE